MAQLNNYSQGITRGIGGLGTLDNLYRNGGKGSGNFGHSGRPGKIGGSGAGISSKYAPEVSGDGRVVKMKDRDYAGIRGELQAQRLAEISAPELVTEEVDRLSKKITDGDTKGADSYLETAIGALRGWSEGNGGTSKAQSDEVKEKVDEIIADLVIDTVNLDYKDRGSKIDEVVSKIGDRISDGDYIVLSKKDAIDGIKGAIKVMHDEYPSKPDFMEQGMGHIRDLEDVMKMRPSSKVRVSEHPMTESGMYFEEVKDKK